MTQQTEAQRLAALIGRYRSPHCGEAAALLRRQDELLRQALGALETCWSMAVGLTEAEWEQVKDALKSIRAHREAK